MIVYVESNFLLELAYLQETHDACERLLALGEAGRITLILPAFCVTEARMALATRARQRTEFNNRLQPVLRELARSQPLASVPDDSKQLVAALVDASVADATRLDHAIKRCFDVSAVQSVDGTQTLNAMHYETQLGLSAQDALVYASVIAHAAARSGAKVFVTRNSNDFVDPDIKSQLGSHHCKLLSSFVDALGYVESLLRTAT